MAGGNSLIEYPSAFAVKVMGERSPELLDAVVAIARRFDPGFDAGTLTTRDSRGARYVGITVTVTATSREQLDGLYRALSAHPLVRVVL